MRDLLLQGAVPYRQVPSSCVTSMVRKIKILKLRLWKLVVRIRMLMKVTTRIRICNKVMRIRNICGKTDPLQGKQNNIVNLYSRII